MSVPTHHGARKARGNSFVNLKFEVPRSGQSQINKSVCLEENEPVGHYFLIAASVAFAGRGRRKTSVKTQARPTWAPVAQERK